MRPEYVLHSLCLLVAQQFRKRLPPSPASAERELHDVARAPQLRRSSEATGRTRGSTRGGSKRCQWGRRC